MAYSNSVAELEAFLDKKPDGLIITGANSLTESELKKLDIKVLHRQDIHRPHVALTTKRLPKSWQKPAGEILAKHTQRPMKYTLLIGAER